MAGESERIVIVGAGIAGLCSAMALAQPGRDILVLEQDPPPPDGDADTAFDDWQRRGVSHLRQSHAFLARLRNIIRDKHPRLLADLHAHGCREITLRDWLPPALRDAYVAQPGDEDLIILTSRRTTLELVMRRYVETLPGVEVRAGKKVRGLVVVPGGEGGVPRVTGVETGEGDASERVDADCVIDAGGKGGRLIGQLAKAGIAMPEETESAGVLYFTRHYRLLPGVDEPPRGDVPASGDLGYIKFGVFPADNGCFSITLCVPEIELTLRRAVTDPDSFHAVCLQMPGLVPWLAPEVSRPVGRVIGMGDLHSRWREMAPDGRPAVLGYFPVGDTLVRTNPLYGRGCSFAMVSAEELAAALASTRDPAERLVRYAAGVRTGLRPYFDHMRQEDRNAIRRARAALIPGHRPRLKARLAKSFAEDGIAIAVRRDMRMLRAFLRGFHMLEHPSAWLKRPANLLAVLRMWARGKRANAAWYAPKPGPDRAALFAAINAPASADMLEPERKAA